MIWPDVERKGNYVEINLKCFSENAIKINRILFPVFIIFIVILKYLIVLNETTIIKLFFFFQNIKYHINIKNTYKNLKCNNIL